MRLAWTAVRVVIVLGSIVTVGLTPFWISSPSGTSVDPSGAVIVAIALAVLVVALWSLWRDRSRLA